MQQTQSFNPKFKLLHWLMALLILTMLLAGQKFEMDYPIDEQLFSLAAHSSLGVIVIALFICRIWMRLSKSAAAPKHDLQPAQAAIAKLVQIGIYLSIASITVSGLATAYHSELAVEVFFVFDLARGDSALFSSFRAWHELSTWALSVLLVLHISAALMHKYIKRDGVFDSMSPCNKAN